MTQRRKGAVAQPEPTTAEVVAVMRNAIEESGVGSRESVGGALNAESRILPPVAVGGHRARLDAVPVSAPLPEKKAAPAGSAEALAGELKRAGLPGADWEWATVVRTHFLNERVIQVAMKGGELRHVPVRPEWRALMKPGMAIGVRVSGTVVETRAPRKRGIW